MTETLTLRQRAEPLLREYLARPDNSVGGRFHLILADGNLDNATARWCLDSAREHDEVETELARLFVTMTRTQRGKLSKAFNGGELD